MNILIWVAAFAIAAALDSRVAVFVRDHRIDEFIHEHKHLQAALKFPGEYRCTILVAILVAVLNPSHLLAGLFMLVACAISGVNGVIKWIAGRTRPFKLHDGLAEPFALTPFHGGVLGAVESKNLRFPSGHAALAFATAACLVILWPRFRLAFYAVAMVVALERVAENAHWLSDTVAAAALGVGCVHLVHWIWRNREAKRLR